MRAALLLPCLLLAAAPALAQERPSKAVPTLAKAPKLDGALKDFASPLTIRPPASVNASASFTARVAWRKETLYVGLEATDDQLLAGDLIIGGASGLTYRRIDLIERLGHRISIALAILLEADDHQRRDHPEDQQHIEPGQRRSLFAIRQPFEPQTLRGLVRDRA